MTTEQAFRDVIAAPWPKRIRGTVRLFPSAIETRALALDEMGLHLWRPIAPCAEVEVALDNPALSWRGGGYSVEKYVSALYWGKLKVYTREGWSHRDGVAGSRTR